MGVGESDIDRLVCPIGIAEIKGKEPAVIAAALAAQLLIVREQVSVPQASPAVPAGVKIRFRQQSGHHAEITRCSFWPILLKNAAVERAKVR